MQLSRHIHQQQQRSDRRRSPQRGMALVSLLALTALLVFLTMIAANMVGSANRSAMRRGDSVQALNMAEAGLDLVVIWLETQPQPPTDAMLNPLTNFFGTNGTFDAPFGQAGTSLAIHVYSDAANPGATQKRYIVESTATMPGGLRKTLRAYMRQESFGKYAYFADDDSLGFWMYDNQFEGPFHTNRGSTIWYKDPTGTSHPPMFLYDGQDAFTSSSDVTWWDSLWHSQTPGNDDLNRIASGGPSSMSWGYQTDAQGNYLLDSSGNRIPKNRSIPLPTTNYQAAYAALGQTVPYNPTNLPSVTPNTTGATVTANGGIYIHDRSTVQLTAPGPGQQGIIVTTTENGAPKVQTITVDRISGITTIHTTGTSSGNPYTSDQTVTGTLNGVIFSDDNITSLSGTVANNVVDGSGNIIVRNSWTVGTAVSRGKDITITDNLKYATARDLSHPQSQDDNFNTNAGILGLVSRYVNVSTSAPAQIEVDATIFATEGYRAENYGVNKGANARMTEIGGVISRQGGIFAIVNGAGSLVSGWREEYHYDDRLADFPPPYYPTIGNAYSITSWQLVTTPLQ